MLLQYGIKDTYFVFEHRTQQIGQYQQSEEDGDTTGLLFHGNSTTFGIRFQY